MGFLIPTDVEEMRQLIEEDREQLKSYLKIDPSGWGSSYNYAKRDSYAALLVLLEAE